MKAIEMFDPNQSKLTFICSPSNPLGHTLSNESIYRVCDHFSESGLIVLDGAYVEFDDDNIYKNILSRFENVIMLRTLSKAFGLAGVRCGALISSQEICQYIERVIPPYSFSTPAVNSVLESLSYEGIKKSQRNIKVILDDRKWLSQELESLSDVMEVYPSHTNFILVRVNDAKEFCQKAKDSGFLLRDVSYQPLLNNCIRITVGNTDQNQKLINGLRA
jgi:histidinol-phosphate aminotransferase